MRILVTVFFTLFFSVFAGIAPKTAVLDNGLKVAVFKNPMSPSVTVFVGYDVGTADDPADMVGLSHMLEHMMFKGSSKFPKGVMDKLISANGGWANAYTNFDSTVYMISLPCDRLELALEIEADRMENLEIVEEEFLPEQKVVLEERHMRIGNHPLKTAVEVAQRCRFIAHPYGVMPIGFEGHIKAYTTNALIKHYKKWYLPNNAKLVVVGPYDIDYVLPLVEKYFSNISAGDLPKHFRIPEPDRDGLTTTVEQESSRIESIQLQFDYKFKSFINEPKKMLIMQLLEGLLIGSDARDFTNSIIKKEKLALDARVEYSYGKDDRFFSFNLALAPNMNAEKAEKFLFEKIQQYLKKGLIKKDFEHAKKEMLNSLAFAMDGDAYLINVAESYIEGFSENALENYEKLITDISYEEVQEMFKLIFENHPVLITRIYPKGKMAGRTYQKVLGA